MSKVKAQKREAALSGFQLQTFLIIALKSD
jgi:hypothetical protein